MNTLYHVVRPEPEQQNDTYTLDRVGTAWLPEWPIAGDFIEYTVKIKQTYGGERLALVSSRLMAGEQGKIRPTPIIIIGDDLGTIERLENGSCKITALPEESEAPKDPVIKKGELNRDAVGFAT